MEAVIKQMPKHWLEERRNSAASRWDEMWDGVLHIAPMPNRVHQRFLRDFQALLQRRWAEPNGGQVDQEVNLTMAEAEEVWTRNYRIPDLVLLPADRAHIDRIEYMAGAPLVCIEIHSPSDESYEKLAFYAGLGVPEVWIIDRDAKTPEVFILHGAEYRKETADERGWLRSTAVDCAMKSENGKLLVLFAGDAEPSVAPK